MLPHLCQNVVKTHHVSRSRFGSVFVIEPFKADEHLDMDVVKKAGLTHTYSIVLNTHTQANMQHFMLSTCYFITHMTDLVTPAGAHRLVQPLNFPLLGSDRPL